MKRKSKILAFLIICFIILNIYSSVFALEYKTIEINTNETWKIENTNIKQEAPTSVASGGIARYSLKYQGSLIENRTEISQTHVYRDGYNYTYSRVNWNNFVEIKRYCFETAEYKTIFDSWGKFDVESVQGYCVVDKVIYIALYSTTQYDELKVVGYDTQTETLSYDKTFSIPSSSYFGEFCVDSNQNIYFVLNGSTDTELSIVTYDKNGNVIDKVTETFLEGYTDIDLTGVDKGGRVLFFSLQATNGDSYWWNDFVIITNNGTFVNNKDIYMVREYAGVTWTFLNDSQTHAYNQYGEFFEIDYNANNEAGLTYKLKEAIKVDGTYPFIGYLYSSDDTYAYLGTEQGFLYIFNWKTYEIEKSLSIGENKIIVGVYKTNSDKIWIEYYDKTDQKYYALSLTTADYSTTQKNIEITDHTSLTHTKDQINSKYNELSIVNNTTDLYETAPSVTSPYVAGSLKSQVKTDTVNQINYFRWLSGLDGVTQNDEYMESSQKGAVVLAANALISGNSHYLTHYPSQPSDMADDFFTPGYKATSGGFGTSANVSAGALMAESIKGYVDDTNNIQPNVGHRLSILDPKAVQTSFGYAGIHGVVNIFSDRTIVNVDNYYSWPSPGYFPIESIEADAMWSVSIESSNGYNISSSLNIVLKANGKEYSSANGDFAIYLEPYYNAYYFDIPDELKSYLVDGTSTIQDGKSVQVEVYGLSDNLGNTYVVKYPVNFFSLDKMSATGGLIGDVNGDGKVTLADYTKILAHVKKTQLLTGDALKAADVNGDGKVTLADYTKVLAHVKKTALLF